MLLPRGYEIEALATGFNAPVHCCFDEAGACYVTEAGHKIQSCPRVLRVDTATGATEVFFELPRERWIETGALTGACWHQGHLYLTNTDTVLRLDGHGGVEEVVGGLPGLGDHQTNHPVVGPDGKLYWGQGSVTNYGVVGPDNFAYEWLPRYPTAHDVPAEDLELVGTNFSSHDVLGKLTEEVQTGAYVAYGTATAAGQVIPGDARCSGAVLRCDPDGSNLEVVAWGLRNPYGIAFSPDGRLYATEHGGDERGARFVVSEPDDLYEIRQGEWYGWPDFASGVRLDDPRWGDEGRGREPVLARHPNTAPPKPVASFTPHTGSNGLDFCRDAAFGFPGQAFVALFGDLAPITARNVTPAGFKVVRVDVTTGAIHDFAVNRIQGPASKLPHSGLERPSHCQFGPDGALYVVDWGEIDIAPEAGGVRMQMGSGTLWRIRRTAAPRGEEPDKPVRMPANLLPLAGMAAGAALVIGAAAAAGILVRRFILRDSHQR